MEERCEDEFFVYFTLRFNADASLEPYTTVKLTEDGCCRLDAVIEFSVKCDVICNRDDADPQVSIPDEYRTRSEPIGREPMWI